MIDYHIQLYKYTILYYICTHRKNSVLKTKRNWSESREQHDLEGLRPGDDAKYRSRRVALQEGAYRQSGGQQSQSYMSYSYAKIGGEYNNRYAVHGAEQIAAGDDEEQIADDDRERHHRK